MITISDEMVSIIKPITEDDKVYVSRCLAARDFIEFIGSSHTYENEYRIYSYRGKNVGCFRINLVTHFGTRIYLPNIYVEQRQYSVFCILKTFSFIISQGSFDKIMFIVYSNNESCLAVLRRLNIFCEGLFKYTHYCNGILHDSYVFSVLECEIEEHKNNITKLCEI